MKTIRCVCVRPLVSRRCLCHLPYPHPSAKRFFRRWQRHQDPRLVASEFQVSARTIRRLYGRFVQRGQQGIAPDYEHCGQDQPSASSHVRGKAEKLRQEHPTWGAPLIRVMLAPQDRQRTLPCARTLQRWFAQQALPPAPAGQHPAADVNRATRAHEVWQMDAAELIALRSGQRVSWLRNTDEFSGAVLGTRVFAEAHFNQVPVLRVQGELRQRFAVWGRPEKYRVDNGTPWGSSGDFPPDLALWLLGLGIDLIWNPPCRPDKNGVVERSQGVGKQWAEPFACDTPAELQRRLNRMDRVQREKYPSIHGQSRSEAYPDLQHSGRCYDAAWEKQHWSLDRVVDYLADYVVSRRVDRAGLVSIYNRNYYVGKHYQGQPLQVFLDPTTLHWVFADAEGRELRTHPAEQISRERIVGLQVTNRRLRKPK